MSDTKKKYTIGWICAINTEYVAAQVLLEEPHDGPHWIDTRDGNNYKLGSISRHNIVVATLPKGDTGTATAAIVTRDMIYSFPNVRFCLMVGIGGGAPSEKRDIRLGDVVVSVPSYHQEAGNQGGVVQFDYGKTIEKRCFQSVRYLDRPPRALLAAVQGLSSKHEIYGNEIDKTIQEILDRTKRLRKKYSRPDAATDVLYAVDGTIKDRPERTEDDDNPEVHYGLVASSDTFMESSQVRDLLADERGVLCFEMEAAGLMNNFPCIVIRGICDYSDSHWREYEAWRGYAALAAAACARDLILEVVASQLEAESGIGELLGQTLESHRRLSSFIVPANLLHTISTAILNVDQKAVLDRLPVAVGACWDSYADEDSPLCLPNTRIEVISKIKRWAANPKSETVFWLNGMAGTGKSTLCRSIAKIFQENGSLGASFFFRRGEGDRGNSSRFFTTVAAQLAKTRPFLASYIKQAIDDNQGIFDMSLVIQFEKLVRDPLRALTPDPRGKQPIVIVIDALDECEYDRSGRVKPIIDIFLHDKRLGLKVLVTSRPEWEIRRGFRPHEDQYQDIILHEIPRPIIERDISVFFDYMLARIRADNEELGLSADWPGPDNTQRLVDMSMPLFIYASTICRFLNDSKWTSPERRLQEVLKQSITGSELRLDATYLTVLSKIIEGLPDKRAETVLADFKTIVGSIITVASPLSIATLSCILSVGQDIIKSQLSMLHSVLSVPKSETTPVRLFHISFRDFLLSDQNKSRFRIDEKLAHRDLATSCLRIMTDSLKKDICGLQRLGLYDATIERNEVDKVIPFEVQYACLNWVIHLQGARETAGSLYDDAYSFLKCKFLQWIEALSLTRQVPESIRIIKRLHAPVKAMTIIPDTQFSDFLDDALHILQNNFSIITTAPLQIYSSVLLFAPSRSVLKNLFEGDIPEWIHRKPEVETDWDHSLLWKLESRSRTVRCVAFSHDSLLLASASDGITELWNSETGECVQELGTAGIEGMYQVAFCRDSQFVVTFSFFRLSLRVWLVHTGECIQDIKLYPEGSVSAFRISRRSLLVVTRRVNERPVCSRIVTGSECDKLEGICGSTRGTALSPDSSLVAWTSEKTMTVAAVDTEKQMRVLGKRFGWRDSIIFSHDSSLIASIGEDKICLWPTGSGKCFQEVVSKAPSAFRVAFSRLAFSHDSSLIAGASSLSRGAKVLIWRVDSGDCIQQLETHYGTPISVAFSYDSSLIAMSSSSNTVWVWRVGAAKGAIEKRSRGRVSMIALSDDSTLVSAIMLDNPHTVHVFRVDTGQRLFKLDVSNQVGSLSLLPDSSLVASSPENNSILLWRADTGQFSKTLSAFLAIPLSGRNESNIGFSSMQDWITFKGRNLVWLPIDFRPNIVARKGSVVVLVSETTGTMHILGFSDDIQDKI
ncbi:hypothetical protein CP533_3444 [Ophiocordyceps camponoti-saundersi (nom. inval.)]|nr:hypothetical protein CP533_3444 [Ophiocordyceps camponoti-saundersi (nom. inval.)]